MADIAIEAPPADLIGVDYVLMMIGFDGAVDRANIMEAGLGDFEDFRYLVKKDIRDMADEFRKRTVANGRIVFGLGRTKKLDGRYALGTRLLPCQRYPPSRSLRHRNLVPILESCSDSEGGH